MPVSKHSQSAEPNTIALLRALLVLSLGWLLLPALAPVSADARPDSVLIEAELRVGEQPLAPVAEVSTTQASLRALNARIRSGAQQLTATPVTRAALLLPQRFRDLAQPSSTDPTRGETPRATRCQWPLPRSSCHADDEPSSIQS
jgi:hypothetical protein